jgi:NAD(P)-dependent dehydrogenase (short-subunit alcohol dehydrogenase family)
VVVTRLAAAKAGVVQLTRDLGVRLARSGVRVNAVLFGPIDTAAQRAVFERNPGALERRLVHWPMGRFGTLAVRRAGRAATDTAASRRPNSTLLMCSVPSRAWVRSDYMNRAFLGVPSRSTRYVLSR